MNRQLKCTSVGQDSANFKQGQVECKNLTWWRVVFVVGLMLSNQVFSETCVIDESALSTSSSIHYVLYAHHPSGSIGSSSNTISLKAFTLDDGDNLLKECIIGNYTNQPDKYEMYYSSENKPINGHDRYAIYADTSYQNFNEWSMYASNGKYSLSNSISEDISSDKCWKMASNYSAANLNRDNNFWTYFCPKQGLLDYIDRTIIEETSSCSSTKYTQTDIDNAITQGKQICINSPSSCGIETEGSTVEAGTISANLDIYMPSLNYETLLDTQNIWADFKYSGTNPEGKHTWELEDYGVNQ
ncbi:hypothetical protein QUF74_17735 [Candidatus Halobeggiatoa sp. HSG11]|nr:hypothetical protein [Candidatus Halobeggiatoa sp. HSG11]